MIVDVDKFPWIGWIQYLNYLMLFLLDSTIFWSRESRNRRSQKDGGKSTDCAFVLCNYFITICCLLNVLEKSPNQYFISKLVVQNRSFILNYFNCLNVFQYNNRNGQKTNHMKVPTIYVCVFCVCATSLPIYIYFFLYVN